MVVLYLWCRVHRSPPHRDNALFVVHVEVECPILARVYRAVATALFRREIASLIRAAIGRVIIRLEKKEKKIVGMP